MNKVYTFPLVFFLMTLFSLEAQQQASLSFVDIEMMGRKISPEMLAKDDGEADRLIQDAYNLWNGRQVKIRGFLYPCGENCWVLSKEPNLKSCCLRASHHVLEQVRVEGAGFKPSETRVVALEGRFLVRPERAADGELKSLLFLSEGKILQDSSKEGVDPNWAGLGLTGLLLVVLLLLGYKSLFQRALYCAGTLRR